MADQPLVPQFTDEIDLPRAPAANMPFVRATARPVATTEVRRERRSALVTIDAPLLIAVFMLLAIGSMMVYSTTFDWSYQDFGSESAIFLQHARNLIVGCVPLLALMFIDYRRIKRFALLLLLMTIGSLIAVLLFGDRRFGAARAFLNGSFQPGEVAELTVLIFVAAWLSSRGAKVRSFIQGLLPFGLILGVVGVLVMLQPDLSTAATIFVVAGLLFFLSGANVTHLVAIGAILGAGGYLISQRLDYAQNRIGSYVNSLTDLTQTNYHAQQAIIAFINGGWTGVGLGQGRQKFGFLPAPHTDSIFAVIGEELGVLGAMFVVLLFTVLVLRGLQIARRAPDAFGSLLAAGVTLWLVTKALLNIAVMLNLVPSTGVALPFISFGGSSLVTAMAGVGIVLSIGRAEAMRQRAPEKGNVRANPGGGWGNRWSRLSSAGDRGSDRGAPSRR